MGPDVTDATRTPAGSRYPPGWYEGTKSERGAAYDPSTRRNIHLNHARAGSIIGAARRYGGTPC